MPLLSTQPTSIAKILDSSIKLFTASFSRLIGFMLIEAALSTVLGLLMEPLTAKLNSGLSPNQSLLFDSALPILAISIIYGLVSFIFYIAMIYRIDNVAKQREDSFIEALQVGVNKFPAMLIASILLTIALIVGFMLLIIPGIILSLSLGFYLYFIAVESLGGYAALKASHTLVWGQWWRTATVFMAPMIVVFVLVFALGLLSGFLALSSNYLEIPVTILTNLLGGLAMAYLFTLGYVQFHDLKLRKFGGDLAVRLTKN